MKIPSQTIQSNITANISAASAAAIKELSPESLPATGIKSENMTASSP
jgi:hypothetical protein